MNELTRKLKAKIPGQDTGIEIRNTLCDICSPGMHCGINAYVKDGKVIKVEGTDGHPVNNGKLCTKGLANKEYIYREDRIKTPLRRVGNRGEGKFIPITWEEAYDEITQKLNGFKAEYGADSVAFYSGYSKWYRPFLRRFAYSYGSANYGTESSVCYTAAFMAWKLLTGYQGYADMEHADLFLGWAFNPYYSNYRMAERATRLKEKGLKFIIIDTRVTPATEKLADLALFPKSGTDGALALCMANILIENGWINHDFIRDFTYGFDEYRAYVKKFNESNIEDLTGVPYRDVYRAAQMIAQSKRFCVHESSAPICHHKNGMQNYRAIMSLCGLEGCYDKPGCQQPIRHTYIHVSCGFQIGEEEFQYGTRPKDAKIPVGGVRFPLWNDLEGEMQVTDLPRQILEGTPYPVKAVFALGMNARMWPDSGHMFRSLEALDFFVDTDLFLTDTAKYADIVLPACSSFERGEFKPYSGGYAIYTVPAIKPLYQSKPDVDILTELANRMDLPDKLLRSGYESCVNYMLKDLGVTTAEIKGLPLPKAIVQPAPCVPMEHIESGLDTPTGKFEFLSSRIQAHPEWGLDSLPTYLDPMDDADSQKFPYVFTSGSRIPGAIHSRLHNVPCARSLCPDPTADINKEDAKRLNVEAGDYIRIETVRGSIVVKANPSTTIRKGNVNLFHGYSEADANSILDSDHLDPYSGFPAFRATWCNIEKVGCEKK